MTSRFSYREMCLAALLFYAGESSAAGPGVDRVFINAKVYTLDASAPWAEAVAVNGDSIVYVGDNASALALVGSETIRHDLNGQMLLPGFIDTHMHPIMGGAYAKALSLDTYGTPAQWVDAIAAYSTANPESSLIFGYGFLASAFGPLGPTRAQIDAVVSDRPVLLMDEGFHGAWANSKALEQLKITRDTEDPIPGFSYYKRDVEGEPTGYLLEGTAELAMAGLDAITKDVIAEGTAYVLAVLSSYGVTSVFDAGVIGEQDSPALVLKEIESAGEMTVRIIGSYAVADPEQVEGAIANAEHWRDTIKGKNYHYRMLKIMLDGTVEGRTAAMFEDYQGEPGNNGKTVLSQQQVTHLLAQAADKAIDVHVHALGERAVDQALNAVESARKAHPESATRYTICHIQVIRDQDMPRFAALDVTAQSTPLWASYDSHGKQFVSDDQFARFWRFNSFKELGVRQTWGSDFPASGAGMLGMSPILQMEIGVTRQAVGEPEAPIQPRESERLDMATLIRGYTIDAAYQLHMEDEIGSIAVGKRADLVVLDKNLFSVGAYEIHETKVMLTLMGGEVVFELEK